MAEMNMASQTDDQVKTPEYGGLMSGRLSTGGQRFQPAARAGGTSNAGLAGRLPPRDSRHPLMFASQRLAELTRKGGNLMRQARSRAAEEMQGRGLLSSSLAVGHAQDAAHRAALPLAFHDAEQANRALLQSREHGFKSGERRLDRGLQRELQTGLFAHRTSEREAGQEFSARQAEIARGWEGSQREMQRNLDKYGIDARMYLGELDASIRRYGVDKGFAASLVQSGMDYISQAAATGNFGSRELAGMIKGMTSSLKYMMEVIGRLTGLPVRQPA